MLLKPDFNLKSIYEIDLELLKEQGIKAIFFDLDSTIMVSKSAQYTQSTEEFLKKADEYFFIAVITNNKKCEYLEKVKSISDFQIIGNAQKPSTKAMKKLLAKINIAPHEVVIVGDRPLTDILAGKFLGAKTILVGSINANNEGIATRFVRWLERRFILAD
ncbi:MAG: YqeG family HAD IIIA-type phosphatase [Candidatus Gastranaerophilales bacterium]|nr:YqeG family HAD IIIA-type phosphatase [Candidatus Gastranaerophilales bacterium]